MQPKSSSLNTSNPLWQRHRPLWTLAFLVSIACALLSHFSLTRNLDWLWYDASQQLSQLPDDNDIVIIEIDERSLHELGRWPWSRQRHAQLLQSLGTSRAVIFDVIFADEDRQNLRADAAFSAALSKQNLVLLPLYLEQLGHQGQLLEITPTASFYQAIDGVGHVHVQADQDGVVRSVFLREGVGSAFWPHITLTLWEKLYGNQHRYTLENNSVDNPHVIAKQHQRWLPMPAEEQGFRHYSFSDILNDAVDNQSFNNKIVFIGATAPGLGDLFTTPVGNFSGVELNAWIFQALRHHQLIEPISKNVATVINATLVLLLTVFLGRLSPRNFLLSTAGILLLLLMTSSLLLISLRVWLPLMPAIVCLTLFYPLWSWRRLEVALNFLRSELHKLKQQSNPAQSPQALHQQQAKQRAFWKTLELNNQLQAQLAVDQEPIPAIRDLHGSELVERTISEITREKQTAEFNRQLIEKSLEQLQDAVLIANAGGDILFTNRNWKKLLFSDPDNNDSQRDLLTILSRLELSIQKSWREVLAGLFTGNTSFATSAILNAQIDLFCQLRLSSLSGDRLDTLIITLTNVSELKAAERSRLEALNFLSHDLRSPMVSVLAILELKRKQLQRNQDTTTSQQFLNDIETLVRKNLSYADSFLQLSRAQSLTEEQLQLCDMHAVVDAAQMQGLALAKGKHIKVVTERTSDDAWVMGDQDALERAIINLLSNAVKYSDADSSVTLSIDCNEQQVSVTVTDQGKGIDEREIDSLFERFTRGTQTFEQPGAGLGLHYVSTVAKRHGGSVSVSSQLGHGSCFCLQLPLAPEQEEL